ncbi:Sodium/calcium exchanger 2 [Aphelenchoides besseyi]|nr:Sodium/calcium exchanger 2 [Aphelenchoides besseyi]
MKQETLAASFARAVQGDKCKDCGLYIPCHMIRRHALEQCTKRMIEYDDNDDSIEIIAAFVNNVPQPIQPKSEPTSSPEAVPAKRTRYSDFDVQSSSSTIQNENFTLRSTRSTPSSSSQRTVKGRQNKVQISTTPSRSNVRAQSSAIRVSNTTPIVVRGLTVVNEDLGLSLDVVVEKSKNRIRSLLSSQLTYTGVYLVRMMWKCCLEVLQHDFGTVSLIDFWGDHLRLLYRFLNLPEFTQLVLMRMFTRLPEMRNENVPVEQIHDAFSELHQNGFVDLLCPQDITLTEILQLMQTEELAAMCKKFKLDKLGSREVVIDRIVVHCRRQTSCFTNKSLKSHAIEKAAEILNSICRIELKFKRFLLALLTVYCPVTTSPNELIDDPKAVVQRNMLSQLLRVEKGELKFPLTDRSQFKRIRFHTNIEELFLYVDAKRVEENMLRLVKVDDSKVIQMAQGIRLKLQELIESDEMELNRERLKNIPDYLLRFTPVWNQTRCVFYGAEAAQRLRDYTTANELLEFLLNQKFLERFCYHRRGHWYTRMALNLHTHLKQRDQALLFCKRGLADTLVGMKDKLTLQDRALMIDKKFKKEILLNAWKEMTITGIVLNKSLGDNRTNHFIETATDGSVEYLSVEEVALRHVMKNGFTEGMHTEGGVWRAIYGLIFYDIFYDFSIPNVWVSELQLRPLDENTRCFYENRKQNIEKRMKELMENPSAIDAILRRNYSIKHGTETNEIDWSCFKDVNQICRFLSCCPTNALMEMFSMFLTDHRNHRSGLPDLTVWNHTTKQLAVVEVKGPGDTLSTKQRLWLSWFSKNGIKAMHPQRHHRTLEHLMCDSGGRSRGPRLLRPVVLLLIASLLNVVDAGTNCSAADATRNCVDGLVISIWRPFLDLSYGDRILRGGIYFLCIAYMFLGVSIVADRFMSSIEVITSMERTVIIKRPGLEPVKIRVRLWNDTVSNLTLMALGSSAPEILLSIIEVVAKGFEAGDLGPNTIVGSAAFNLFMITAICVMAVPCTEVRRQKHLDVFFVTATWSIFAYIWMYVILAVITPGVIDIWEGVVTFAFFPLTVLTAWITDIKILHKKFVPHRYRRGSHGIIATEGEEMKMLEGNGVNSNSTVPKSYAQGEIDPALRAFEDHRREFIEMMREIRRKNPHLDPTQLQKQAEYEMISRGPKSRAFYRVQATRRLIGGGDLIKRRLDKEHDRSLDAMLSAQEKQARQHTCRIFFDPAHYTVLENVGSFNVIIGRDGGPEGLTIMVDYYTEDATAVGATLDDVNGTEGADYIPVKGTLTFAPEDRHKHVTIEIVDDDVFEEDEHFYLHLTNLRVKTKDGLILDPSRLGGVPVAVLEMPTTATIMILDDDHAGIFGFEHDHFQIVENCGHLQLKVSRSSGCRGEVIVPYHTYDGTALGGKHYEGSEGELHFSNNQTEAFIDIGIVDTEVYERSDFFYVELHQPVWSKKMSDLHKVQDRFSRRIERKRLSGLLPNTDDPALLSPRRMSSVFSTDGYFAGRIRKRLGSWVGSISSVASAGSTTDENTNFNLTDDQLEVAELGKPRLGEYRKCQITIKESKEFQGVVDRMLKTANTSFMLGTSSWREQFIDALTVSAGDDDDDEEGSDAASSQTGESQKQHAEPTKYDYIMHFLTVPWKLLFATIPPTDYWGGWACFNVSILMIGILTAVIGDLASQFGCWVGLKDAVTAISFVALGTSVPDTFASRVSAVQDKYADNSIGNVTGSNAVNVFLGIGIAWTMAAVIHWFRGTIFRVDPGTLAFSVTIFCIEALICIVVIVLRRHPKVGGELGGPRKIQLITSGFFCCLWLIYIGLSALESYCVITGF